MEPKELAEPGTTAGTPGGSDVTPPDTDEVSHGADATAFPREDADGFCSSSADEFDLEFEFAALPPPSTADADDIFDAGRIRAAYYYPVFARPHPDDVQEQPHLAGKPPASTSQEAEPSAAPPEGEDYCVWVPRKSSSPAAAAEGAPDAAWKSRSAGAAEASRRWRLRDLVHAPSRSHSDGTQKFAFLAPAPPHRAAAGAGAGSKAKGAGEPSTRRSQEHRHKKGATEMDIVTAHRLFYAKNGGNGGAGSGSGGQHQHHRQSYLPYRTDLVGHFSSGGSSGPHTRFLPF